MENKKFFGNRQNNNANTEIDSATLNARSVYIVKAGGKVRRFSVSMVVKTELKGKTYVGIGKGSSRQFNDASKKAISHAKKNLFLPKMTKKKTLYAPVEAYFHGTKVMLLPATRGSGIKSCSVGLKILQMCGYEDVTCKILSGSKCCLNIASAIVSALKKVESISEIARRLNKTFDQIVARKMLINHNSYDLNATSDTIVNHNNIDYIGGKKNDKVK